MEAFLLLSTGLDDTAAALQFGQSGIVVLCHLCVRRSMIGMPAGQMVSARSLKAARSRWRPEVPTAMS
jgi:hypothetical protein